MSLNLASFRFIYEGKGAQWRARWAHNSKVRGSKPCFALFLNKKWKHRVLIPEPLTCKASAQPVELYPLRQFGLIEFTTVFKSFHF